MRFVILDASIVAKWVFLESGSDKAEKLLLRHELFYVPDLFYIEMDAVISKKFRKKELNYDEAYVKREQVKQLAIHSVHHEEISELAFEIAITLPITIYDSLYIALAIESESILWTADDRLVRGMENTMFSSFVKNPLDEME
ncbi:type II toxin-antitoxin system VapC family toxin [Rhodohalobacter sp.]|uniref:type II toxin-antitoxin system VapC family toxin n=1 Tax=Rhodohalobacter sp. TaxID=1974210 RepID=UPI002ACE69BD|nr:type II toxin-antitoxin system VapC family toxin [Rhodohalobacter sp.]MDZ7756882.1 type II toxin-antitoxin system VapC family toxin [Rhodohalobacter sp.]